MGSLQNTNTNYFYIVQKVKVGGRWKNEYRKATEAEIEAHRKASAQKERTDLAPVTCARPDCDRMRIMTRDQKRDLKTIFVMRYGQFSDIYCSVACREKHAEELKLLTKSHETP